MQKILFIDRDGTLIEEPVNFQVDSLDKIKLCPGVIPALLKLQQQGYKFIMVSNQDGLGTSSFPEQDFRLCHDFMLDLFSSQGIRFDKIVICPHLPEDNCRCRKPKTALLDDFFRTNTIDRNNCWVIGDRESDEQLAANLNVGFLPRNTSFGWDDIAATLLKTKRQATITRKTKETEIKLNLTLDKEQQSLINTPIPFFSHMLEQIAKHGGFDLSLDAQGDVEVDDHHLIEDTALALGDGLRSALADKWGINRFGFTLPMDESLAAVAIDISGRAYCRFEGNFSREFVGGMATEMVPHFFKSFASALNATVHISVSGSNHHHMIEACFKALGRALNQACMQTSVSLPTTKGVL